jgi:ATP-dependent DNA ligase
VAISLNRVALPTHRQAAGAVALDSTLWSALFINSRMSLHERTRPGLGTVEPCLPSPDNAPPSGPGWIHEIKHDGFPILARRDSAGAPKQTRGAKIV